MSLFFDLQCGLQLRLVCMAQLIFMQIYKCITNEIWEKKRDVENRNKTFRMKNKEFYTHSNILHMIMVTYQMQCRNGYRIPYFSIRNVLFLCPTSHHFLEEKIFLLVGSMSYTTIDSNTMKLCIVTCYELLSSSSIRGQFRSSLCLLTLSLALPPSRCCPGLFDGSLIAT